MLLVGNVKRNGKGRYNTVAHWVINHIKILLRIITIIWRAILPLRLQNVLIELAIYFVWEFLSLLVSPCAPHYYVDHEILRNQWARRIDSLLQQPRVNSASCAILSASALLNSTSATLSQTSFTVHFRHVELPASTTLAMSSANVKPPPVSFLSIRAYWWWKC